MQDTKFAFGPLLCSKHSRVELLREIRVLLDNPEMQPRTINCVNAHIFNLAWENSELVRLLNQSRVVAADGMSVVWAARLVGVHLEERCNMTESFHAFMRDSSFPQTQAILVGGTEEIAEKAREEINRACDHLNVVSALSGYLPEDEYRAYLRQSEPLDFVLLGMGTPKTEKVSELIAQEMPEAIVWHVGGGSILFLGGHLREAPQWMRRRGLQWLHRFALEPGRLWKRYLIGNILFVVRLFHWYKKDKKGSHHRKDSLQ